MCVYMSKTGFCGLGFFCLVCYFEEFFFKICLWNRSLNSGSMKGGDVGWEFLAQSSMRFCNEPWWRDGFGEHSPGKILTWLSSQKWFRINLQSSSCGHREKVTCAGERLKEGRAPASGVDTSVCQAIMTTALCNASWEEQMQTPFLCKTLPNYSLATEKPDPFQLQ